jgi:hypothetical protein
MLLARRLSLVAVLACTAAFPASAAAKLEFNLPVQIFKVFDESGKSDHDPGRCDAIVFLEFPKITRAVGYRIVVRFTNIDELREYLAPPFDTIGRGFITRYPAPKGFARFFVGAYSTGDGCPAADARTENAKIVEAKVSLDKQFEKRFKESDDKPWKCAYRPGSRTVKLGGGPRLIIVRRRGTVTTTDKGSNQPIIVHTNTYAEKGTIIKTGPNSIVKIGSLRGGSVLVGSNTTVRLTRNGFEILEQPRNPHFKVHGTNGQDFRVRTCSAVLSARG